MAIDTQPRAPNAENDPMTRRRATKGEISMPVQNAYAARMYIETFSQFRKQLGQLEKWLVMAMEYAKSKNFDPNVFPTLRLAPDQFPLTRQVQIACDTVKLAVAFLTGKPAQAQEDSETAIEQLQ